jgi:hypothetical protein
MDNYLICVKCKSAVKDPDEDGMAWCDVCQAWKPAMMTDGKSEWWPKTEGDERKAAVSRRGRHKKS